jgi:DNA polymerase III delta prime subunit
MEYCSWQNTKIQQWLLSMNHQLKTIHQTILAMATERGPNKTICPSEVAREMFPENWRKHMEEIRQVAVELHQQGKVSITQKGEPVDVNYIKGPIRIKII